MDQQQRNLLIGIGALGCVLMLGAVAGVGFLVYRGVASAPMAGPRGPAGPAGPAGPTGTAAPAAAGFVGYQHSLDCRANPQLVLPSFTVQYPAGYQVLPCTAQTPSPWSYVTFHRETPAGAEQITVSFGYGLVTPDLLGQAANDLVSQLGATGPTRELDRLPYNARGASLVHRDAAFDIPRTIGPFTPGTYVFRQIHVPGQPNGVTFTFLFPATSGEAGALAATEPTVRAVVESFRF